jgi:hypothetical protein
LFQSPTRFSLWLVAGLALLAAYGVDAWRSPTGRALYWSRLGLAAAAGVLALAALALMFLPQAGMQGTIAWAAFSFGVFAFGAGWLNLRAPADPTVRAKRWSWLVALLLAADLLFAGWGLNPGASLEIYTEDNRATQSISQRVAEGRLYLPIDDEEKLKYDYLFRFDDFFSAEPSSIRSSLLPNTNLLSGVASANNFDPLVPGRYREWLDMLENAATDQQAAMLTVMHVSLIEHYDPSTGVTFESRQVLPRAFWVNCARPVASPAEAYQAISASTWSPGDLALVETTELVGDNCGTGLVGQAEIISSSPNTVHVRVEAPGGGWLVLADTWYPGWQAKVGGYVISIFPANGLFRAVPLSAGEVVVEFDYRPVSFSAGLAISTVAWLVLFYLFFRRQELR